MDTFITLEVSRNRTAGLCNKRTSGIFKKLPRMKWLREPKCLLYKNPGSIPGAHGGKAEPVSRGSPLTATGSR